MSKSNNRIRISGRMLADRIHCIALTAIVCAGALTVVGVGVAEAMWDIPWRWIVILMPLTFVFAAFAITAGTTGILLLREYACIVRGAGRQGEGRDKGRE